MVKRAEWLGFAVERLDQIGSVVWQLVLARIHGSRSHLDSRVGFDTELFVVVFLF